MLLFQCIFIKFDIRKVGFRLHRWKWLGFTEYNSVPQWRGPFPIVSDPQIVCWDRLQQWSQTIKEWHHMHTHNKHTLLAASPVQPAPLTRLIVSSPGLPAVRWAISNESLDDCQSEVMSLKLSQTSKETRWWNIYTPRDKITPLLCCACHANRVLFSL